MVFLMSRSGFELRIKGAPGAPLPRRPSTHRLPAPRCETSVQATFRGPDDPWTAPRAHCGRDEAASTKHDEAEMARCAGRSLDNGGKAGMYTMHYIM